MQRQTVIQKLGSSQIGPYPAQYVEFNTFYLENISVNNTLDLTCELYLITSKFALNNRKNSEYF